MDHPTYINQLIQEKFLSERVRNFHEDWAHLYSLENDEPWALFIDIDGFLRLRYEEMDLMIDDRSEAYDQCDHSKPIPGEMIWAADPILGMILAA